MDRVRLSRAPALFLAMALLLPCSFAAGSSASKIRSVKLYGQQYVPIEKWAESKGFKVTWNKRNKTVNVASRWARLEFLVDSKKASINGLTVWLTSAIAVNGSTLYIADRDLDKTITPLLYPGRLARGKKIRTIVVAAGHGGKDPGYQINREQEKKYTLLMAKALQDTLESAGFKVVMTRDKDVFVDLPEQAARANRARADLFITIHYNAAAEREAKGVETFCLTPEGATSTNGGTPVRRSPGNKQDSLNALLSYHVHKSLVQNASLDDRGLRRAAFLVLRDITMPGVFIEGGFLSNPSDAEKILNPAHRRQVARAIVDGVLSFKRLVERK